MLLQPNKLILGSINKENFKYLYKMKVIELLINDQYMAGADAIALVEMPAIEQEFHAFGKQTFEITDEYILEQLLMQEFGDISDKVVHTTVESHDDAKDTFNALKPNKFAQELAEKQMIIAPIMRANFKIPREDKEGNLYEVFFSADTIKQISYKMMKEGKQYNVNIEHDGKQLVDGVYMVESWLVEDPSQDKSTLYGYAPSQGDWYGMYSIENKDIWDNYIKTGKVKGVSAEGYFIEQLMK
jgi:hypothetical protein